MISKSQKRAIQRAVRQLVKAEVNDSWKGGGNPADIPIIEMELKETKARFHRLLNRLTEPTQSIAGGGK